MSSNDDDDMSAGETLLWGVILLVGGGAMFLYGGGYCIALQFTDYCLVGGSTAGIVLGLLGVFGTIAGAAEYREEQ